MTTQQKPLTLLGQLTPQQFLTEYWQKKPLLIRQAIPNFNGLLDPNELAGLACEDEVQSRIIQYKNKKWHVKQGPFEEKDFAKLPEKNWTLLVQSVNHHLPTATDLLAQFNFIPHARLDDLMVSYAPDGGGVGAHFDSYDVFLLQGSGKRNWKISGQQDFSFDEDAPIKVLTDFVAEQEWVLEAGDMLYLPPQFAHLGVAEGEDCMTYSIGFRAPKTQELAHEFLSYMQEHTALDGLYADPDLSLQPHPAEITTAMVSNVDAMLKNLIWNQNAVADFLGCYLTEPKMHIVFEPVKKISLEKFAHKLTKQSLYLELKTQMLFWQQQFYLNGERIEVPAALISCMQLFADKRCINVQDLDASMRDQLAALLLPSYLAGYFVFEHDLY
ncbi:MAG: cupin domain-containing protein [Methylophilus sp.]|jgi:50S ribosomal protein L16 3-hydroxylase